LNDRLRNKPRVALLHEYFEHFGGAERVLVALKNIFPEAELFFLTANEELLKQHFPDDYAAGRCYVSSVKKIPFISRSVVKFIFMERFLRATEAVDLRGYDIVISSSNSFIKGAIVHDGGFHLSYVHSPTRFLWDYHFEYLKERSTRSTVRHIIRKKLEKIREYDYCFAQRPQVLVANSKNVRTRIKKYYTRDAGVVYPPVDINRDIRQVSYRRGDYFLVVSYLTPFKKVDLIVKAFDKLMQERLIVVGEGPQRDQLEEISSPNVSFVGRLSDQELAEYYRNCKAVISAVNEDFGIVPVEAHSFGKPVIGLNAGGFRETIYHSLNGLLFERQSTESITRAIEKFLAVQADYDPEEIFKTSTRYGFQKFKEGILSQLPGEYSNHFA
jgi:glycosyltransferase involved in cell wall biosynthesis